MFPKNDMPTASVLYIGEIVFMNSVWYTLHDATSPMACLVNDAILVIGADTDTGMAAA
jgi:hypothetical protein